MQNGLRGIHAPSGGLPPKGEGIIAIGEWWQAPARGKDDMNGLIVIGHGAVVGSAFGASLAGCICIGSATQPLLKTVEASSFVLNNYGPWVSGASSIAIGSGDTASLPNQPSKGPQSSGGASIAIGCAYFGVAGPSAGGTDCIAIGRGAASQAAGIAIGGSTTAYSNAVAMGNTATCDISSAYGVAIGTRARCTSAAETIAIGGGINTTAAPLASAQGAIAIGATDSSTVNGARASGITSIAIGSGTATAGQVGASATAADAIALGRQASAAHSNATALGQGVASTNTNQLNIGTKRLFAGVPTTAPADADLIASQVSFWVDETGNLLTCKVKYSGGTVKNGTVALV